MKMRNIIISELIVIVFYVANSATESYCDKNYCSVGLKHIGCGNNGAYQRACPEDVIALKAAPMLPIINVVRNQVAGGFIPGFPAAKRMATMAWNIELANLAVLNLKKCNFELDECVNTLKFLNVGQVIMNVTDNSNPTSNETNEDALASYPWTSQLESCDLGSPFNTDECRDIITWIIDGNTHTGCARMEFKTMEITPTMHMNSTATVHVTCNFAQKLLMHKPVYEEGETGTGCRTGMNIKYKYLCSLKEQYNLKYPSSWSTRLRYSKCLLLLLCGQFFFLNF